MAVLCGGMLLFALGLEGPQVWPVALLRSSRAARLAAWIVVRHMGGAVFSRRQALLGGVLLSARVGVGSSLVCAGLMFFKNALHAHLFLDYPLLMLLAMLQRGPAWAAAGALLGLSTALLWAALRRD